jgi:hypothetical protein
MFNSVWDRSGGSLAASVLFTMRAPYSVYTLSFDSCLPARSSKQSGEVEAKQTGEGEGLIGLHRGIQSEFLNSVIRA